MQEIAVAEILKRVRRVRIVAHRAVNDLFAGQYKSVFRGRGMEFEEVREYQPGDEIRSIDWNVTARSGSTFVKRFREERELTILFLVDVSGSGVFGSGERSKWDLTVELAALLMFSALRNNDKIGMLTFDEEVVDYFPPRKGKSHMLRLIRQLVALPPRPRRTDLAAPLMFLNRVQRRRAVVFLMSDFLAPDPGQPLAIARQRHDLIAVRTADPRESTIPDASIVTFADAETGELRQVDTRNRRVREALVREANRHAETWNTRFRGLGIDELSVSTGEDYSKTLRRFFRMRERRFR